MNTNKSKVVLKDKLYTCLMWKGLGRFVEDNITQF